MEVAFHENCRRITCVIPSFPPKPLRSTRLYRTNPNGISLEKKCWKRGGGVQKGIFWQMGLGKYIEEKSVITT